MAFYPHLHHRLSFYLLVTKFCMQFCDYAIFFFQLLLHPSLMLQIFFACLALFLNDLICVSLIHLFCRRTHVFVLLYYHAQILPCLCLKQLCPMVDLVQMIFICCQFFIPIGYYLSILCDNPVCQAQANATLCKTRMYHSIWHIRWQVKCAGVFSILASVILFFYIFLNQIFCI